MYQSAIKWGSIFSALNNKKKTEILKNSTLNIYKANEKIFVEDRIPFGVYILEKGLVKLYKTGDKGKSQIFQINSSGDVLGIHPVINETNYPDSAETIIESSILFIPKQHFINLLKNTPEINYLLMKAFSNEFYKYIEKEIFFSQKSVLQRVAIMLIELNKIFLKDDFNSNIILNRRDLADICGTTKESLVRTLQQLKKDKLISSDGKFTKVINEEKLTKIGYF